MKKINFHMNGLTKSILIIIVVGFVFFGPKPFWYFFHNAHIKEVSYIEVTVYGGEEESQKQTYRINDEENINKIMETLKKFAYNISLSEMFDTVPIEDRGLALCIQGDSKRYFSWTGHVLSGKNANVFLGTYEGGIGATGIAGWSGLSSRIGTEQFLELREMILDMIEDEIQILTEEDIERLVQNQEMQFVEYEDYYYAEVENTDKVWKEDNCAEFRIDGSNDVLRVLYRNGTWGGSEPKRYHDVRKVERIAEDGTESLLYELELEDPRES